MLWVLRAPLPPCLPLGSGGMVRWHRDVDAEYGDCNFICTILFAEPAAEDPMLRGPKTA